MWHPRPPQRDLARRQRRSHHRAHRAEPRSRATRGHRLGDPRGHAGAPLPRGGARVAGPHEHEVALPLGDPTVPRLHRLRAEVGRDGRGVGAEGPSSDLGSRVRLGRDPMSPVCRRRSPATRQNVGRTTSPSPRPGAPAARERGAAATATRGGATSTTRAEHRSPPRAPGAHLWCRRGPIDGGSRQNNACRRGHRSASRSRSPRSRAAMEHTARYGGG